MMNLITDIDHVLKEAEAERERNRVQIALGACLGQLPDRKKEIEALFEEQKRNVAVENVMIILGSEIEEAVRGRMIVPEYSQKSCAKQQIYVFIGTHWEVALTQVYYDFVKDAARRIGLSEIYVQKQKFMNELFENVAFRVSKHIATVQPYNGVWVNLKNCTVKIDGNGMVSTHQHRADDFFTYCLPYGYDPNADCPRWLAFLDEVLPEKDAQALLGQFIGYCFTQNLKLEKMAVFYGGGANGKSVCLDVIKNLMGRSNVSEVTLSTATNDPEPRSLLDGKLLNISSESEKCINTSILKMMVSGEPVQVRELYRGTRLMYNPPKFITSYNELPPLENTLGYRRRWLLFPFDKTIPADRQDAALTGKLCRELPGILNWVVANLVTLLRRVHEGCGEDFTQSELCNKSLDAYFKSANSATMFFEEMCKQDDSVQNTMKCLYDSYKKYCVESGITKPCILKNFKKALHDWGAKETVKNMVKYFNVYVAAPI